MVDVEIIKDWVIKADEDFQFAVLNLKEKNSFYAQICFHFHQAAEKYLKAFIVANELEFRKIHDLLLLLKICSSKDSNVKVLQDACEYLNTFYVETRYPVHWPTNFTYAEAEKAFEASNQICSVIKGKITLKEGEN
jgi:HEPN domain-containing protein